MFQGQPSCHTEDAGTRRWHRTRSGILHPVKLKSFAIW